MAGAPLTTGMWDSFPPSILWWGVSLWIYLVTGVSFSEPLSRVTVNTVHPRPLAMGGAFISIEDDLPALVYNPAGFRLKEEGIRSRWFFNPIGLGVAIVQHAEYADPSVPIGLALTGAGYRLGRVHIGIIFGEETFSGPDRLMQERFFDLVGYEEDRNFTAGFSVTLAPKVSIGIAGEWYLRRGGWRKARFGHRYGLIVRPREGLSVGLCFVDLPSPYPGERMRLDRFSDESLHIGVSYEPWRWIRVSMDFRNVSDQGSQRGIEPHWGIETVIGEHLALRAGHYRAFKEEDAGLSAGIGIRDIRLSRKSIRSPLLRLEITGFFERNWEDRRWILLSFHGIL